MTFHVDDLKVSHKDPKVIDDMIQFIDWKYGDEEIGKVKATRGKKHDYLAMTLDYSEKGKVKVDMRNYVKSMIEYFPTKLNENVVISTPACSRVSKGFSTQGISVF